MFWRAQKEAALKAELNYNKTIMKALAKENEALRTALGLMTTIVPDMEIDIDDPVGMAQTICSRADKIKAALEGWQNWWALPFGNKTPYMAEICNRAGDRALRGE